MIRELERLEEQKRQKDVENSQLMEKERRRHKRMYDLKIKLDIMKRNKMDEELLQYEKEENIKRMADEKIRREVLRHLNEKDKIVDFRKLKEEQEKQKAEEIKMNKKAE